jgi:hypothetical protein
MAARRREVVSLEKDAGDPSDEERRGDQGGDTDDDEPGEGVGEGKRSGTLLSGEEGFHSIYVRKHLESYISRAV